MAFVLTPSSTNEVNTANVQVSTASTYDNTANLKDAIVYAFLRTEKKITINGSDTVGYDKSKVECFNYHKMGYFARECRGPRNQESRARNQDSSRRTVNVEETASKAMVAINGASFDCSYMADKEAPTNLALMAFSDSEAYFHPPTIDLSNSGLKEFQQPEFEGYGFKDNKNVCENSSNEFKKITDAPIIEDWVSDCDEDDSEVMVLKSDNVQHKPEQANQHKNGTGQKKVRPVWNNAMRVNHKNFSNSRKNFVPTAVLTKSRIVPVSATRLINTTAPKSFVNVAKTRPNSEVNSVNTTKGNIVTSVVGEQRINVVKSSACWADSSLELKVLVVHHTTNGHQFTMSNRQERVGYSRANGNCTHISILLITYIHMANMDFCDKHNMVAFLQKPTGSEEFHQIVDFLAGSHIRYALTANPTIYVSLIEQFWQTITVDTVNDGEQQLTVTVDGQTIAITEASVRRHL
ncbi:ribonuclease H-like domain-containing protein [Tanacetum coccineum]